ncbi:hypothetical protein A3A93_03685 [Candidatus Roizmanbacteria bacterium RIFCSPLOWO2_01_FULL_38_12]|uniref:Uncharacterized protein n=1 Tax=Candidatus Roizmanbacteria bacterium RIFCSPLOWO2_01_FULL_38_12 TaxID=1802061 RepID=A0A1F7IYW7_9BACT|nr:MAG: hypothetical protein A3A93_03685 [Candidatus Roizmanbacteria bacterium RIFCSPLOWO2_01_FULL_38_12]
MELSTFLKLIISLCIGAAVGLEREVHEKHELDKYEKEHTPTIGVRTLALTTALGTISGLLYHDYFSLFLILTITSMFLIGAHYVFTSLQSKRYGITTEIATIYTYLIGLFIGLEVFPIGLTLSLVVLLMIILANKERVAHVVHDVHEQDLKAIISYALIAMVILPFLPNREITLKEIPYMIGILKAVNISATWNNLPIINPFLTWLIVAVISGVDLLGYMLEKMFRKGRGFILTSILGGFVSSTATTQSLAAHSKKTKKTLPLVAGALFSTLASFFPAIIVLLPLNAIYIFNLLPTLSILIVGFAIAGSIFWYLSKNNKNEEFVQKHHNENILSIKPALFFAFLYISIKLVTRITLELFGQQGFLVAASLAAFTGIDAVAINIAELSGKSINYYTGVLAFILINSVNLLAKTIYINFQGQKDMALKFGFAAGIVVIFSFLGLLFV